MTVVAGLWLSHLFQTELVPQVALLTLADRSIGGGLANVVTGLTSELGHCLTFQLAGNATRESVIQIAYDELGPCSLEPPRQRLPSSLVIESASASTLSPHPSTLRRGTSDQR